MRCERENRSIRLPMRFQKHRENIRPARFPSTLITLSLPRFLPQCTASNPVHVLMMRWLRLRMPR
jgi:hypothetical protein